MKGGGGKRRTTKRQDRSHFHRFFLHLFFFFETKMDALLASVRSAADAGTSLADQRALLDAGVEEIVGSGGAANLEALRAPLQAALDAEPALPRSIFYLYLL